jgi:hypothetical protein
LAREVVLCWGKKPNFMCFDNVSVIGACPGALSKHKQNFEVRIFGLAAWF